MALWLSVTVRGRGQVLTAGGVMAVAVCAMHYTAMAAVQVHLDDKWEGAVQGVAPISLELPITLLAAVALVVLAFVALQTISSEDRNLPMSSASRSEAAALRALGTFAAADRSAVQPRHARSR